MYQVGSRDDLDPVGRPRTSTITQGEDINSRKLPTVFKMENPDAKTVYISGSYDNWKSKIPMVKRYALDNHTSYIRLVGDYVVYII